MIPFGSIIIFSFKEISDVVLKHAPSGQSFTEDEDKILNLITTGDLFCRVKGNGESICWKQAFTTFIYRCKLEVKSNVSKESTIFNRSIDQVRQRYKTIQKK